MLGEFDAGATIAVKDLAKAREFYEGTLGLQAEASPEPGTVLYTAGSAKFLVYESQYAGTNQATYLMFSVPADRMDAELAALRDKGVEFDTFDASGMPGAEWQDGVLVGMGMKSAWFRDPDGNILNVGGPEQ
jgi:catechol 2,3-dioxygenase-like lactoylglutathione lyase family enzyme